MKKFKIINGPNLNLLGEREPEIYGTKTLTEIQKYTQEKLQSYNFEMQWFQSNLEGKIVSEIQNSMNTHDVIIINPAGYSHTSIAILDALRSFEGKIIEVHLSNVYSREDFRQTMLTAKEASKIISGFGVDGYYLAILSELN